MVTYSLYIGSVLWVVLNFVSVFSFRFFSDRRTINMHFPKEQEKKPGTTLWKRTSTTIKRLEKKDKTLRRRIFEKTIVFKLTNQLIKISSADEWDNIVSL